jgi:chlorobactene glucosyltransferase
MILKCIFGFLHLCRILVLVHLTRRMLTNLRFMRRSQSRIPAPSSEQSLPQISVLIPARNEAANITACVSSLATQSYPGLEIILLNDQSTDTTGALCDALAEAYPHVRVIHGTKAPPPQWNGKSYACDRLAQHAQGEWLLFTDADTVHQPDSLRQSVLQAEALEVDLLSLFPRQVTQTWAERLMVPFIMDFLALLGTDLEKQWRGEGDQGVANGQYMLIRAAAYRQSGGHEAIGQALVDDLALAHHLQLQGYKTAMLNGTRRVACRMYQDSGQVWRGFSKNLLLGMETAPAARQVPFHFTNIFILPLILLPFERAKHLLSIEILWMFALRGLSSGAFGRRLTEAFTAPLAALGVIALALNGMRLRRTARTIQWKDRDYPIA